MTLVPCLYTGPPGELELPEIGGSVLLVPGETVVEMPKNVAHDHLHFWPVDADGKVLPEKAKRLAKADAKAEKAEKAESEPTPETPKVVEG